MNADALVDGPDAADARESGEDGTTGVLSASVMSIDS